MLVVAVMVTVMVAVWAMDVPPSPSVTVTEISRVSVGETVSDGTVVLS